MHRRRDWHHRFINLCRRCRVNTTIVRCRSQHQPCPSTRTSQNHMKVLRWSTVKGKPSLLMWTKWLSLIKDSHLHLTQLNIRHQFKLISPLQQLHRNKFGPTAVWTNCPQITVHRQINSTTNSKLATRFRGHRSWWHSKKWINSENN